MQSLPSRERGLKSSNTYTDRRRSLSLPSRERGLKSVVVVYLHGLRKSLPSRERGLKSLSSIGLSASDAVAPLAGAWIEISDGKPSANRSKSLPSRERGLKLCEY